MIQVKKHRSLCISQSVSNISDINIAGTNRLYVNIDYTLLVNRTIVCFDDSPQLSNAFIQSVQDTMIVIDNSDFGKKF